MFADFAFRRSVSSCSIKFLSVDLLYSHELGESLV